MTKYIAEIGLNHMGSEETCMKMVRKAVSCGVDGITIQIFPKIYYNHTKPFRRSLDDNFYKNLSIFLNKRKVLFGLAVTDSEIVKKFYDLKINFWKILSFEFYNDKLINLALKTKKKVYLSTGVASMKDIIEKEKKFKKINFIHTVLHRKIKFSNIGAINLMKYNLNNNNISFTLHTNEDFVVGQAITLEADPIFFYIKNEKNLDYPDNSHAIKLSVLKKKIKIWKKFEVSMGTGIKKRIAIPKWVFV
jgi:sialic acid synthase SpsE